MRLEEVAKGISSCRRCPLHASRLRPVPGEGPEDAGIFVIGEAPGREEDEEGRPFVGRAGRILRSSMLEAGVDPGTTFITNAVKCRPPGNRRPRRFEIKACSPWLRMQLEAVSPKVIVLLGGTATEALGILVGMDLALRDVMESPIKVEGSWGKSWVLASYHPAYSRYNREVPRILTRTFSKARELVE